MRARDITSAMAGSGSGSGGWEAVQASHASRSGVTVTLEPSISGSGSRVMVTKPL